MTAACMCTLCSIVLTCTAFAFHIQACTHAVNNTDLDEVAFVHLLSLYYIATSLVTFCPIQTKG